METFVVNRDDNAWTGHPDISYYKGKFYVVYRHSDHHRTKSSTKIMMCTSDDGIRWSNPNIVAAGHRFNCPRLKVVEHKLVLCCDVIAGNGDLVHDEVKPGHRIWLWTFNGNDWSGPIITNIEGIVPDRVFQTKKGTYLIAAHRCARFKIEDKEALKHSTDGMTGRLIQTVWRSDTLSTIWEGPIMVANKEGHNFCEASIFDMRGYIGCMMRENSRRGDPSYICLSSNDGKQWTSPRPTRMMGCHRPVSGLLRSGKVLTTYREQMHSTERPYWAKNVFACLSSLDNYRSDKPLVESIILPLDHDSSVHHPDGGYTGWVQDDDENIFVVNYITNEAPFPYIVCYKFSESDF